MKNVESFQSWFPHRKRSPSVVMFEIWKLKSQIKICHFYYLRGQRRGSQFKLFSWHIGMPHTSICSRYQHDSKVEIPKLQWKLCMEMKTLYTTTKEAAFNCMSCQLSFSAKSVAKSENSIFYHHWHHHNHHHHHLYWLIQRRESIFHWHEI